MKFNIPFNKHDAPNLKGYWKLNGDGIDETGNNNLSGLTASFGAGIFDRSTMFNSGQSLVGVKVLPTENFTISFWVKTTANDSGIFMEDDGGNNHDCEIFIEGGKLKSKVGSDILTANNVINDGLWHYVVMTLGDFKHTLYIDGVRATFGTAVALNQPTQTNFTIGKTLFGQVSYLTGELCDFSIFNGQFTLSDVVAQYNNGEGVEFESLDSGMLDKLIHHYKLNGSFIDEYAGLPLEQKGVWSFKDGVFNLASSFDGSDRHVTSTDFDVGAGESFTVSAWVKWEGFSATPNAGILAKGNNQSVNYAVRTHMNTREIYFSTLNGQATEEFRSGLFIKNNEWSFVSVIVKGSTIRFYVDGVVTGQNLASDLVPNTHPLHIGWTGGMFHAKFNGLIDEVAFWKEAKSLEFIDELYTQRRELSLTETYTYDASKVELKNGQAVLLDPVPNDMVCYWKLDKDGKDMSGNNNNAEVGTDIVFNGSARFTGTGGSYIRKNIFEKFPSNKLTVAYWVKSGDTTTQGTTFHYSENGNNAWAIENHRNMRLELKKKTFTTGKGIADGNWHFVCTTWTNDGNFKLWIDGEVVYSRDDVMIDKSINSGGSLVLGQDQDKLGGGFDFNEALIGEMKNVMVFNASLSAQRIEELYNSGQGKVFAKSGVSSIHNDFTVGDVSSFDSFTAVSQGDVVYQLSSNMTDWEHWDGTAWSPCTRPSINDGISGYWKLDELQWSNDGDVKDYSNCGHDGTADGARPVANGIINRCGDMQGTINLGYAMEYDTYSVSLWVKGGQDILTRGDKDGKGFNIKWFNNTIIFQTHSTADQQSDQLTAGWHHVVVTYGAFEKLYIDGLLQTNTVASTTVFNDSSNDVVLGGGGLIDEVVYYKREINADEVILLHNNGNGREITGYLANSAATINANIGSYPAGQLFVKSILIPGTTRTLIDEIQVGYTSITNPTVNAGVHKETRVGVTVKPFSDATASDAIRAYYKVDNGSFITIRQGGYATLLEAIQNISYTTEDAGRHLLRLKIETINGYAEDSTVVNVKPYIATFNVVDAITNEPLTAIEFNAGDGSETQFLASPFTWEYKKGIFSAVIKRAGNVSRVIEVDMTQGDTTFSVELGKSVGQADLNYIAKAVWDVQLAEHQSIGSVGEKIEKNLTDTRFIALKNI